MPSKLSKAVCYLSGSMEYAPNNGVAWRQDFMQQCKENDLDVVFIDPTNKPRGLMSEGNGEYQKLRDSHDWKALTKFVKRIRRDDLRCVDLSDFLVVCIDRNIHSCGTYDELFSAEDQQKPLLCIVVGGKENLPGWLFAVLRTEEIFDSVEDCVNYLKRINEDELPMDDRWVLIREHLREEDVVNA
jgi:hypothetical protein